MQCVPTLRRMATAHSGGPDLPKHTIRAIHTYYMLTQRLCLQNRGAGIQVLMHRPRCASDAHDADSSSEVAAPQLRH